MELLLWLYFYDNRWFFNLKVPVQVYKFIWFLPLILHFFLISAGIYYLQISNNFSCVESLRYWLYHRSLFSFLISLNIIFFMIKISQEFDKENIYFQNARRIYPILNSKTHEYDYWIRKNSLFSTSGVLLLLQGLISLFWSYIITALYKEHYYDSCDLKIQQALNLHSIFIFYSNLLLFVIFVIMVIMKLFFNLLGNFHPRWLITIVSIFHRKRSNLKTYFYSDAEIYTNELKMSE
jgi:hypothetical protein